LDDLIVGAWSASPSGQSDAGKSYVIRVSFHCFEITLFQNIQVRYPVLFVS
jgi:hypothetical protein